MIVQTTGSSYILEG